MVDSCRRLENKVMVWIEVEEGEGLGHSKLFCDLTLLVFNTELVEGESA